MRQIKSKRRVQDFGEVFTAEREVKAMCDLVSDECNRIDSRFLEPACGNGNFLVEILKRKFERCKNWQDGLAALNSLYGIDIQQDNVDECRKRLIAMFVERFGVSIEALFIVQRNIVCGNTLKMKSIGENGEIDWDTIVEEIREVEKNG